MFPSIKAFFGAPVGLATVLALVFCPTASQALPADGEKFKDWTARCETDPANAANRQCVIVQTVQENETQQNIMSFVVAFPPNQDQGRVVVVLPLGADLRAGIDLKVDGGAATHLDFGVCLRDGCQATLPLDAATLDSFKRGTKGEVTFRYLPRQKTLTLPLSFSGFTAAVKALR